MLEHLIIGIDFGLTGTGKHAQARVAYQKDGMQKPEAITDWPGINPIINRRTSSIPDAAKDTGPSLDTNLRKRFPEFLHSGGEERPNSDDLTCVAPVDHKVPTVLAYPESGDLDGTLKWGFLCPYSTKKMIENFKGFLDEELGREYGIQDTIEDVQACVTDFVKAVYEHLEKKWKQKWKDDWPPGRVEYYFSVPTTWGPKAVSNFEKAIQNSGVGGGQHRAVSLTEAEAAAIHLAREKQYQFKKGDTFIVCDAGGGTTDLAALTVISNTKGVWKFSQPDKVLGLLPNIHSYFLDPVLTATTLLGGHIGSVWIDREFEDHVNKILCKIPSAEFTGSDLHLLPRKDYDASSSAAYLMTKGEFQALKSVFGRQNADWKFYLKVPGLPDSFSDPEAGIENGQMKFIYTDIEKLFTAQVDKLYELVNRQLERLKSTQVSALVLCGGLGSSIYVRDCLSSKYKNGNGFVNAKRMAIHSSRNPQLDVCKGLVTYRWQALKHQPPFEFYRPRERYGILVDKPYNGSKRKNMHIRENELDGKTYMINEVLWFDQRYMTNEQISLKLSRRTTAKDPPTQWTDEIVMPKDDYKIRGCITTFLGSDTLNMEGATIKRKHWYSISSSYLQIDYEIRPIILPQTATFEVWVGSKEKTLRYSEVEWKSELDGDVIDKDKWYDRAIPRIIGR